MRRRNETIVLAAVLVGGFCWLVVLSNRSAHNMRSRGCWANLRQIGEALQLYTRDCGEFPRVAYSNKPVGKFGIPPYYGWSDAMQPYIKCYTCFQCVEESHFPSGNPTLPNYMDFWINRDVTGQKSAAVKSPNLTLLIGDGNYAGDKSDSRYNLNQFPATWLANAESPMFRHLGGANYIFTDGHAEWLRPQEVEHFGMRDNPFALR